MKEGEIMEEIWEQYYVNKYGYISVSNLGNVKNKHGRLLSKRQKSDPLNPYYYIRVNYTENGERKIWQQYIHILVAKCFIDNPENKPEVNHKDANKLNNCVDNLEWNTRLENMAHAASHGLMGDKHGENNGRHRLIADDVPLIKELYNQKIPIAEIARKFNVGWTTISHVIKNETWTNI